jgi:hypothetical protein
LGYENKFIKHENKKSIFEGNTKILTFDSEASRHSFKSKIDKSIFERQALSIFSIYDGQKYYNGYSLNDFIELLELFKSKYKNIIMIAHNLSYDLSLIGFLDIIFKNPEFLGMSRKSYFIGNVSYIKYANKNYSLTFLDSFNFFKTSLRKISENMGNKKYTSEEEYKYNPEKWNKYLEANKKELCDSDTKILYDFIVKMTENKNIIWGISGAGSSFNTFISKYLDIVIDLKDFNQIALLSYRGGRNEIYDLNKYKDVIDLDINSLYPLVMRSHKYSYKFKKLYYNPDINYIIENIKSEKYNYLINIDYDVDCVRNPILSRIGNKLIEVNKNDGQWITGRELLYLYKFTNIKYIKLNDVYEFYNTDLFTKYVDDFYKLKQNSKGIEREFYKLMLNSLYGKLGQNKSFSEFKMISQIEDKNLKEFLEEHKDKYRINYNGLNYSIYSDVVSFEVKKEPKFAVLIASEITANARLYNFKIQNELGYENVIYTDTDSFFIINKSKKDIEKYLGGEIGQMKIENQGVFHGYGLKNYIFIHDGEIFRKLKGIKKDAIKLSENKYEQNIIIPYKNKEGQIIVKKVIKNDNRTNDKLQFNKNGHSKIWNNREEYIEYTKGVKK